MIVLTQRDSRNRKLGENVRATYRKVGDTCPSSCSLLESGKCYAMRGPTRIQSERGTPKQDDGERLKEWVDSLPGTKIIRHLVSGDLFLDDEPNTDFIDALLEAHEDNPENEGWGYTHGWRRLDPVKLNKQGNLTINASCDSLEAAQEAKDAGWPTVVVVEEDSGNKQLENGTPVVICPNQTDGLSCSECGLCMQDREAVIGFREH